MERCAAGNPPSRKDVQQLTYLPSSGPDTCPVLESPSAYEALSAGPSRSATRPRRSAHSYLPLHHALAVAPTARSLR
jgi:hypothetical protein